MLLPGRSSCRLIEEAGLQQPGEFMPFVKERIGACQLLLLLSAPELRGGLVEAGIAYALQVPVWLLHRRGESYSSSAGGCAQRILAYRDAAELETQLSLAYQTLYRL